MPGFSSIVNCCLSREASFSLNPSRARAFHRPRSRSPRSWKSCFSDFLVLPSIPSPQVSNHCGDTGVKSPKVGILHVGSVASHDIQDSRCTTALVVL